MGCEPGTGRARRRAASTSRLYQSSRPCAVLVGDVDLLARRRQRRRGGELVLELRRHPGVVARRRRLQDSALEPGDESLPRDRRARRWSPAAITGDAVVGVVGRRRRQVHVEQRRRPSPGRRPRRTSATPRDGRTASASSLAGRVGRGDRVGGDEGVRGSRRCRRSARATAGPWPAAGRARSAPPAMTAARPPLDLRLERHVVVERLRRPWPSGRYLVSRVVADLQLGEDRRAGVAAAELAHLPLLGQHPQRVAHLGAAARGRSSCVRGRASSRFHVVTVGNSRSRQRRRGCRRSGRALGMRSPPCCGTRRWRRRGSW